MSHDCTKATNQSPSSWCQGKLINMQFLLCVSICCSCVLRCSFDAAINLPSHPLQMLQMFTLTQGWLDFGGHDSWPRSLQPRVPHTLSVDFILFFLLKCQLWSNWLSLLIRFIWYIQNPFRMWSKLTVWLHDGDPGSNSPAAGLTEGKNSSISFGYSWFPLTAKRSVICSVALGGASRLDEPQQHASSRSGPSPYKQALIMGWSVAAGGNQSQDPGERRWLTWGGGWWWSAQQERRAMGQLLVKWLRF